MSDLISPIPLIKLKVKKLTSEYQKITKQIKILEDSKINLELEILNISRQILDLNQKLDKLEDEVIGDLSHGSETR